MHLSVCVLGLLLGLLPGDGDEPIAIINARILVAGKPDTIAKGTVLVRKGRIEEVGTDVRVPRNAVLIDAKGGSVMPGLVNANSRMGFAGGGMPMMPEGMTRGRRGGQPMPGPSFGGGGTSNAPRNSVLDALDARQQVFEDVLKLGVTTVAIKPGGSGIPGQGAVVRPVGGSVEAMTVKKNAFLLLGVQANTSTKDMLKNAFANGKKEIERKKAEAAARERAAATPPAAEGASQSAPASRPASQPAQAPAAPPAPPPQQQRTDPNLEPIIDAIEHRLRVFVDAGSANEAAHFFSAMKDHMAPFTFLADQGGGTGVHLWAEELGKAKAKVVIPPQLTTVPLTRVKVNPARELLDAGVEVSFGLGSTPNEARRVFFDLLELVRAGLTPDEALHGVTINPSRLLGVDDRVGSIEKGKDANLILFSGDPLDPTSRMLGVWLEGKRVYEAKVTP